MFIFILNLAFEATLAPLKYEKLYSFWGLCLQTPASEIHYLNLPPSFQILDPPMLVDSKQWIGSFEVNIVLNHLLGVSSISPLWSRNGRQLLLHFRTQGTPIMICYHYQVTYCSTVVTILLLGMHRFCPQFFWKNRVIKAMSKMLA